MSHDLSQESPMTTIIIDSSNSFLQSLKWNKHNCKRKQIKLHAMNTFTSSSSFLLWWLSLPHMDPIFIDRSKKHETTTYPSPLGGISAKLSANARIPSFCLSQSNDSILQKWASLRPLPRGRSIWRAPNIPQKRAFSASLPIHKTNG